MKIEGVKVIKNKVWKYLMQVVIRELGSEFRDKMNSKFKMGAFIGGLNEVPYMAFIINVDVPIQPNQNKLFLSKQFESFLEWLDLQDFCEGHYPYEVDKTASDYRYHVIKVAIPKKLIKTLEAFVKGDYSKMYTPEQIEEHFTLPENTDKPYAPEYIEDMARRKKVLLKDPELREEFLEKLNEKFNTTIQLQDLDYNVELEFPPTEKEDFLVEGNEINKLLKNEIR